MRSRICDCSGVRGCQDGSRDAARVDLDLGIGCVADRSAAETIQSICIRAASWPSSFVQQVLSAHRHSEALHCQSFNLLASCGSALTAGTAWAAL